MSALPPWLPPGTRIPTAPTWEEVGQACIKLYRINTRTAVYLRVADRTSWWVQRRRDGSYEITWRDLIED